ncbi:uncharacterized protein LOC135166092 [Diachasmimorpha longicaudata]|uniref:uncharacterized protein LOC135166092 n=1 Tax=Diachasmimorpha longicaudata TaxID=58733 RepID=UPI0030B8F6C7
MTIRHQKLQYDLLTWSFTMWIDRVARYKSPIKMTRKELWCSYMCCYFITLGAVIWVSIYLALDPENYRWRQKNGAAISTAAEPAEALPPKPEVPPHQQDGTAEQDPDRLKIMKPHSDQKIHPKVTEPLNPVRASMTIHVDVSGPGQQLQWVVTKSPGSGGVMQPKPAIIPHGRNPEPFPWGLAIPRGEYSDVEGSSGFPDRNHQLQGRILFSPDDGKWDKGRADDRRIPVTVNLELSSSSSLQTIPGRAEKISRSSRTMKLPDSVIVGSVLEKEYATGMRSSPEMTKSSIGGVTSSPWRAVSASRGSSASDKIRHVFPAESSSPFHAGNSTSSENSRKRIVNEKRSIADFMTEKVNRNNLDVGGDDLGRSGGKIVELKPSYESEKKWGVDQVDPEFNSTVVSQQQVIRLESNVTHNLGMISTARGESDVSPTSASHQEVELELRRLIPSGLNVTQEIVEKSENQSEAISHDSVIGSESSTGSGVTQAAETNSSLSQSRSEVHSNEPNLISESERTVEVKSFDSVMTRDLESSSRLTHTHENSSPGYDSSLHSISTESYESVDPPEVPEHVLNDSRVTYTDSTTILQGESTENDFVHHPDHS